VLCVGSATKTRADVTVHEGHYQVDDGAEVPRFSVSLVLLSLRPFEFYVLPVLVKKSR